MLKLKEFFITSVLLMPAVVVAEAQAPEKPSTLESLIPFLLIFVMMYFLLIRPQVKKTKEHAALMGSLKQGDEVVTSGGLIGRVKSVSSNFIVLDVGMTNLKVLKANVTSITNEPKKT